MTSLPLVSVVIPNWNGLAHLETCFEALHAQTYPNLEIITVDNASTDGSQTYITANHPDICLISLPTNRGFTGACNTGMEAAKGEIVILLNNDTEAAPTWIEEIVAAFDRHPEAGMVACKMLLFSQRDTLHTAGDLYGIDGLPRNRGVWQKDDERFRDERYVFSACGGSSAYRRAMLDQIGLLDDDFFFSCEDVDLGWRAQLAGWKAVYAPRAVVYHHLKATGGGATASYYDGRNTLWLIAKNYPAPLLRKHFAQVAGAQWGRAWAAIKAWRGAEARATLRGMLAGLISLPAVLRKRQSVQAMRRVPLDEIETLLKQS